MGSHTTGTQYLQRGETSKQGLRAGSRTGSAVNGEATARPRPSSLRLEEQELRASLTTGAKRVGFFYSCFIFVYLNQLNPGFLCQGGLPLPPPGQL